MAKQWSIGIDLGGTKVNSALVSESGEVAMRTQQTTEPDTEAVVQSLVSMAKGLLPAKPGDKVVGIGVGVAGQVDSASGNVLFAPNLEWRDFPLQSQLEQLIELPVTVLNDVRAAAWGEWLHGAGQNCNDMVCVFVGTGIGGGVVCDGKMLEGDTNAAGEFGHLTIDLNGPACHCRNRGCLEALASGWAIADQAQNAIQADPKAGKTMLKLAGEDLSKVTGKTVTQAYQQGDPLAQHIVREVGRALGAGTVSLIHAFNPKRLIFGGGVIEGLPHLIEEARSYAQTHALEAALKHLEFLPAKLGGNAGAVGAAAYARRQQTAKLGQQPFRSTKLASGALG